MNKKLESYIKFMSTEGTEEITRTLTKAYKKRSEQEKKKPQKTQEQVLFL